MPFPMDTEMNTKYHGNLVVTEEMRRILSQEGFIDSDHGGERLRGLYVDNSSTFHPKYLSKFGQLCFFGSFESVRAMIEGGDAPDLHGTETAYHFGYTTLLISGSQQIVRSPGPDPSSLKHSETLRYLLSKGCPPDVPDITGHTTLHHVVTSPSAAPEADMDLARILITEGKANVDAQNRYGEVPLFMAMQRNYVEAIELLLECGARMDIKEADGLSPDPFYIKCGPQVTAAVSRCLAKRRGDAERLREEKKCERCGAKPSEDASGQAVSLKNCARCQVARYCSKECQKEHWHTHKSVCRPFNKSTTVTVKPHYMQSGFIASTSNLMRETLGINTHTSSKSSKKSSKSSKPAPDLFQPASSVPETASNSSPKALIIKAQVPYNPAAPAASAQTDILVYTKKRDLMCHVRRRDDAAAYDTLSQVIREKGIMGAKAYFAAELRGKDELVIKVADVLAEQPF